jgi:uncharacterized membrane protein
VKPPEASDPLDPAVRPQTQRSELLAVGARSGLVLAVGIACLWAVLADWHSPARAVIALAFLLFGPGLALGDLLAIDDPVQRLAIAAGCSLGLETVVSLILLYAGDFSIRLDVALILGVTACACIGAVERSRRRERRRRS